MECFDAIHYKLLRININTIDQLTKGIRTGWVDNSLQNINDLGFSRQFILKITIFAGDI